jgi:GTP-binding protein Era
MSDEIPYESDVIIEKIDEEDTIDRVQATIVVEKEVQKRMIVGKGGEAIKRIGIGARKIMEQFAQKKIHLELLVTVKPGWSKNKIELERFGYIF